MRTRVVLAVLAAAMALPWEALAGTNATPEEAKRYAAAYIEALTTPDLEKATRMIDWDAVLQRAASGTDVSDSWREEFLRGASRGTDAFVGGLRRLVEGGGRLSLINVRKVDGETRIVLRLLDPEGGVSYHEMPLVRDDQGSVRARDVYVYTTAESISETLRRAVVIAGADSRSLRDKLAGKEDTGLAWAFDFNRLMEKIREGDGAAAVALYRGLPEAVRHEKAVMIAYVAASSLLGDDAAYARAMGELRAAHPRERGLDLMYIDWHLLAGRYDDALRSINRVDEAVGGDPYLDVMRSNIYVLRGDLVRAAKSAVRASEREPDLEDAWWARVNVALARKDFPETASLLRYLRDDLEVDIADLTTVPAYSEFVQSPAYREYLK